MKTIFNIDQKKGNSQRKYQKTIGEKLYWSLGHTIMAVQTYRKGETKYTNFYKVRSCVYHGSMDKKNTSLIKNCQELLEDEKLKMKLPHVCYYCGDADPKKLVIDHMIPKIKGGKDFGENLVPSCKHCNSSKGGKDMLEWMKLKEINPSVLVLRRYLKLALLYCKTNDLLDYPASDYKKIDLPFTFELIPIRLPDLGNTFKYFIIDLQQ